MFKDRFDAAEQLVGKLTPYKADPKAIILAIPRGAVELGAILARELRLPLDVILSKKIGAPNNPEAAIGAVSAQHIFVDASLVKEPFIKNYIEEQVPLIRKALKEREMLYRAGKGPLNVAGKTVIVVDDGVATGNTLLATIALIRAYHPKKIVVALPVLPPDTIPLIQAAADELVFLLAPAHFMSVGQFYRNFNQVDDDEVIRLLNEAQQ